MKKSTITIMVLGLIAVFAAIYYSGGFQTAIVNVNDCSTQSCIDCLNRDTVCWQSTSSGNWYARDYGYANGVCSITGYGELCSDDCSNGVCDSGSSPTVSACQSLIKNGADSCYIDSKSSRCDGNTRNYCVGNNLIISMWDGINYYHCPYGTSYKSVSSEYCSDGCSNGICNVVSNTCSGGANEGEWKCIGSRAYVCDSGDWDLGSSCDYCKTSNIGDWDEVCGQNVQACTPGIKSCVDDNTYKICKSDGSGWSNVDCQANEKCSDGVCKATSPTDPCLNKDCNDNNLCTEDSCTNGICANLPKQCPGGFCEPSTGACESGAECTKSEDCESKLNNVVQCVDSVCQYTPAISCKAYQVKKDNDCTFSLGAFFTGVGFEEYYADNKTAVILGGALIVVVIILLLALLWPRQNTGGF